MTIPLDHLFSSTVLTLFIPDSSFEFPPKSPTDEWLRSLKVEATERRQAFFDEQLQSLLVLRIKNPDDEVFKSAESPPDVLLDLLAYIQVSLEASYISPLPTAAETPKTARLLMTPKTGAMSRPTGRLNPHPSILPPSTPNPTPATGDQDRKYTASEGTLLVAHIWGTNAAEGTQEDFSLLWSEREKSWIAIYRMVVTVSFIRLNFTDPLLCLTVSATLREKPIPTTPNHPLAKFLTSIGKSAGSVDSPREGGDWKDDEASLLDGLEEVNLLEGLLAGPTFAKLGSDEINLPSVRLGTVSRQKLFSLAPVLANTPIQPSPSPMTAVRKSHPTLRKSYRKTLQTASGFRVRMRTVFVPYVLLPETEGTDEDLDDEEKEQARREAGSAEKTVVLCVEVENSGDMGNSAGFLVENVQVVIGGEGARATLIGWGDHGFTADAGQKTFPLRVGPLAQYNLLYAVTFMRSPEEIDAFSFARSAQHGASSELHRAVTINVFGKPYFPSPTSRSILPDPHALSYPTQTFSSRWNCVLDLSAQQAQPDALDDHPSVMPEPASPFPGHSVYSGTPQQMYSAAASTPLYSATAGSKRFTLLAGATFASRTLKAITPSKSSYLRPDGGRDSPIFPSRPTSQLGLPPTSAAHHYLKSPTTYSAPPPPPIMTHYTSEPDEMPGGHTSLPTGIETPTTPAFPPFPPKSALPPTPTSMGPVSSSSQGNVGQSVEIKRARGMIGDGVPSTPLPFVSGAFGEQKMLAKLQGSSNTGDSIVVSVGLLPIPRSGMQNDNEVVLGPGKIYPLQIFTLDIFVFNQSLWPRRFEVTCPERRRRRRGGAEMGVYDGGSEAARKMGYPGVLPLDSRIRIGPLRPSACQSVRMNFLAVSPGVHSIDALTLTDVETGFSMNLRSVIDVVVHDPEN
ncbi:TRAPP trafficking subunit Trs65-domain-containing protein [Crepidotus variabilis]|uniref:TRAPP trafficking subunit Trs65-domain-containing protein n=1 Tax=Crepidotus variabilis TaxID=179855 RepID=A0A9P6EM30_9AGAR|nr:TRAPP trafficking subunit Trs65-domain-containing protein [Crepidotus variabilis]